ncbi:hypothetical protein Ana3638_12410 [Anaerocolumna sedimenticola]|uniref:Uncharacterized protein n=1 Tax=Anaerocolumna sedimenticola TaxID=2696063 RepID=A0A6P1TJV5_9FIRM|nr:hypothetical protein [Anaerocolumna sedimenticola]QHQ61480.1 hypothetical protein Ana3638_12410 [Anaerocolumna sedimenticola]
MKNIMSINLGITISIEAKLKDWIGACLQAQRYLCFSDYSYVALPSETIKNVNLSILQESGIGLLSVHGKKVEEILPAKKSISCDYGLKYICKSY